MDETLNQGGESTIETSTEQVSEAPVIEVTENIDTNTEQDDGGLEEQYSNDPLVKEEQRYLRDVEEEDNSAGSGESTDESTATTEVTKPSFTDRPIKEVEQAFNRAKEDGVKEFLAVRDKYIAKAGKPIVTVMNEETGREERYYADYTAEQAFQYGIDTGDYDPFLTSLSSLDVKNFLKEHNEVESKWNSELENLEKEKTYKTLTHQKQEDMTKWDSYIKENCKDSPAVAHVLNNLKNEAGFDKYIADKFVKLTKEAIALEANKSVMAQQSESVKKAMMGSTPIPSKQTKQVTYKKSDFKNMSDAYFEKHKAEIERQMKQGLIK